MMIKRLNQYLLTLTVLVVVLVGAVSTTPAYADDGTTGEPTPAPTEESPPVEEPAIEPAPAETVETILEGIPEGTEVVVLNEEDVEPLATQEAVQIILQNDPIWCPGAALPNDSGCTAGYATVTLLIANLGGKSGAGTIYFTSTYATNDAYLDHSNPNLANLTDLSIQGGWNGSTAAPTVGGTTTFNSVPLSIVNWVGNVTLNDIIVDGAAIDSGIYVQTAGNIILDNTSATDNGFDGADLINYSGTGNVTVNSGNFSGNDQAGLYIASQGVVILTNVIVDNTSALVNDSYDGSIIDNSYGTGNVNVIGSTFTQNLWDGLYVKSAGNITLNGVTASNNLETGAYLNALIDVHKNRLI
jgi:hypothetical protein